MDLEVITYYVGANRTEGIGATHIEVSAVQSQENFDVIEAISLDGKQTEKQLWISNHKKIFFFFFGRAPQSLGLKYWSS